MFNKKNIILTFTLLAVLFTSVCISGVSADTSAEVSPVMSVDYINLSFRDAICIKYAVYAENTSDVKLLVWNGEQSEYTVGTHNDEIISETTQNIGGKKYAIFDYTGVTAKQMADVFYARAYVQIGENDYYSPVCKYSVLSYAYSILGKTGTASTNEDLKTLMTNMLAYGASAQTYLSYKTDRLATMDFYQIKVVGGTLSDGCDKGLYLPDDQVTMTAPAVDTNGIPFTGWQNSAGETVSNELTFSVKAGLKNEVYTATYGVVEKTYSVTFVDYDGTVIGTVIDIKNGGSAAAPNAPTRDGYIFTGWDKPFDNVTSDLVVTATYKADSTPAIYVKNVTVTPGQKDVNVELCVRNNPGILGMSLTITYDDEAMTLTGASNGEATSALSLTKAKVLKNGCNFYWDALEINEEDIADGTILDLTFDIADNASGTYEISFSYVDGDIIDNELEPLTLKMESGKVTVE